MDHATPTRPTLVVCGSIHYDVMLKVPRFPQQNDRLVPEEIVLAPGGMGGNVAAAFARLGGAARFVGTFPCDDDGTELRADLERDGVETRWATTTDRPSHRGLILIDGAGDRAILGHWPSRLDFRRSPGQPSTKLTQPPSVRRAWTPQIAIHPRAFDQPIDGFYCPMNYAPVVLDSVPADLPVYMDLETDHLKTWETPQILRCLARATVIFGNAANLQQLCERVGSPDLRAISEMTGTSFVATHGATGCVLHDGSTTQCIPGYPARVRDTTGAGDCFAAAYILAALRGELPADAADVACLAASRSVEALGSRPGVPSASELHRIRRDLSRRQPVASIRQHGKELSA